MSEQKRGLGYCLQGDCDQFGSGVFLLETDEYDCIRCGKQGKVRIERRFVRNKRFGFYRAVIVHFNYNYVEDYFVEQAIVELNDVIGGDTFEIEAVITRTEGRALEIAEKALAAVNSGLEDSRSYQELNYSGPDEEFQAGLDLMAERVNEQQRRIQWHPPGK